MVKRGIIFLCIVIFFGLSFSAYHCEASGYETLLLDDLHLLSQAEPTYLFNEITKYALDMKNTLILQDKSFEVLNSFFYLGYCTEKSYSLKNLYDVIQWKKIQIDDLSTIWLSNYYADYYKLRTEKHIKKHVSTGVFDYNDFIKCSKKDYDTFVQSYLKEEKNVEQLTLMLQDKMIDRIVHDKNSNNAEYFQNVLSLRQTENKSKKLDHIYQFFESRVRLQIMEEIIQKNQPMIKTLINNTRLRVYSKNPGTIQIDSAEREQNGNQIFSACLELRDDTYQFFIPVSKLVNISKYDVSFIDNSNKTYKLSFEGFLGNAVIDDNGALSLNIDSIMDSKDKELDISTEQSSKQNTKPDMEKNTLNRFIQSFIQLKTIVGEMNKYSVYLNLKSRGLVNNYTKDFEKNKAAWIKGIQTTFKQMDIEKSSDKAGMTEFIVLIKEIRDYNNRATTERSESWYKNFIKFRESILLFKPIENAYFWILDMLFKINYVK